MTTNWTLADMLAIGHRHAETEHNGDLEGIMDTMSSQPVYGFYPLAKGFSGYDTTRRYYTNFCENLAPNIVSSQLIDEWAGLSSLAQEYTVTVNTPDGEKTFNVVGILFEKEGKIGGERIYASDEFIHLLVGDLLSDMKPVDQLKF